MFRVVLVREIINALGRGWKTLLAVHLGVAAVSAGVLGPLSAMALQGVVSWSGQAALSDTAIAERVVSPPGAVVGLVLASVWVTLQLLGYAALLVPARTLWAGREARVAEVPPVLGPALPHLLRLSLRFVLWLAIWSLPFLGGYAAVYAAFLNDGDINYYLSEKPPSFWWAAVLAALVGAAHAITLARVATGWVHAVPLVIFRGASPGAALRLSARASRGQRKWIAGGLVIWALGTPLLVSIGNMPWSGFAMWMAAHFPRQPSILIPALGLAFAFSLATGWLVGCFSESLLALHHLRLYQQAGLDGPARRDSMVARGIPEGDRTMLAGALGLCAVTIFLSFHWFEALHTEHPAVVIAHRGASTAAPENTLAAVRAAVQAGADWVEIDVQESADGTVYVFHDKDFRRFRGPGKPIWELRDAEIDAVDIGSWKSLEFSAERAPRLSDVLAACRGKSGVLIELKHYGHAQRLEERVVEVVEAAGQSGEVMVMSLDQGAVRRMRVLRPGWPVGLLSTVAVGDVTRLDVDFLGLNARTADRRLLRGAAQRGVKVHVWTVNDPLDMAVQLSRGVDGLITDDPALARSIIRERSEASFPEKLMLALAAMAGRSPPPAPQ